MSYYPNYESYTPFFYKSSNYDEPIISQERYIQRERYEQQRYYQENRNHSYQFGSWNEGHCVTPQLEQPEMSTLECLRKAIEEMERKNSEWKPLNDDEEKSDREWLRDAVKKIERQNEELDAFNEEHYGKRDEKFNWNFESNHEKPYETFTYVDEHLDNVEAIETHNFDSNRYAPYSSNCVFQDDCEDGIDEEKEENEDTNYSHDTSQFILQDLHTLEPKVTKDSDFEDSDYEDFYFEECELGIEEEKLVEDIVDISDTSIFEEACNTTHANEKTVVLENQIPPNHLSLDEELQILLGDEDINELRKDGMMTEEELLESMEMKVDESHPPVEEVKMVRDDDMLCLKTSQETSLTYLQPNTLPCEHDHMLAKEPKPPDPFIRVSKNHSLIEVVLDLKIDKNEGVGRLWLHTFSPILEVVCHVFLRRHWGMISLISRPPENKWVAYVHITTIGWRMFYQNDKTKVDFLLCEYDWKGSGNVMKNPHIEASVGEFKPR